MRPAPAIDIAAQMRSTTSTGASVTILNDSRATSADAQSSGRHSPSPIPSASQSLMPPATASSAVCGESSAIPARAA